jgi:predicted nucleic acid-binding protein
VTAWLVDTSALVRLAQSPDAELWARRATDRALRVSVVTRLELGYSARSGAALRAALQMAPLASMPLEHLTPSIEKRAIEVQVMLADLGHHRAPGVPDLLVAATAELAGLTVLHVDKDFELIARLTGQPTERLSVDGR